MRDHAAEARASWRCPFGLARLQAKVLSILPNAPLTEDQVELLKTRQRASATLRIARAAPFVRPASTPRSLAAILPTYLWTYRRRRPVRRAGQRRLSDAPAQRSSAGGTATLSRSG